jgi:very-short-patch-repair endonuclease
VVTDEEMYYLDMGWEDYMVAVEYDGEHHRTDPLQYRKDIRRLEALERMGWIVIRVVAGDDPAAILRRVRLALDSRNRVCS